ncbi:MAG: ATP-binding cassette domain-containing protein, partial [Firmicutes bacterium]|nr:ATP-binding cassette domain-containing protein [Bacillota bacterium]
DHKLLERYDALQEEYKNRGGYTYKSEMTGVLSSMAFKEDSYHKKISTLSGGERTRLALACLLLRKPDILFLDEPTNHLDIGTLKWLEQYLKNYKGTIVVVSHDRYFLDQTVNRIFEIENHKLNIYEGSYSFYAVERKNRREAELRKHEKQKKEIDRQEEMIRRFKQHGTEKLAKRAASREKRLSAMELTERPGGSHGKMKLSFKENFQSGKDVIYAENLSKTFGYGARAKELFKNVDLDIKRGERVCIVGANGIGKTTLLKMLMGDLVAGTGRIKHGHNVQIGYYDQGQLLLNNANTVIDELHDSYRLYTDGELRNILGRFLFRGESVFLNVGALSGGEKARLSLLKLMMSGSNVLILDEPTNHLDIESKEVFEEALLDFPGTCIIVSLDRYFLNRIPTRIMELTADGMENYLGAYDYYVEKKQQIESGKKYLNELGAKGTASAGAGRNMSVQGMGAGVSGEAAGFGEELSSAEKRKLQKEKEAEERRIKRQKDALEKDIAELEEKIAELEAEVCKVEVATDHVKLAAISGELEEKR